MEQKHLYLSALGVGIGVGIGLASGQTVNKWTGGADSSPITPQIMEQEMLNLIFDGRDSKATFDDFPYYLSEQTRVLLTSAAFVYLKNYDFTKHTRNLAPASRTILLSGPAELYQQMLAKALAHYFQAKLLLLDTTDFSLKIQAKYGAANKQYALKRSISETTLARMSGLFRSLTALQPAEEPKGAIRRQRSIDAGSRCKIVYLLMQTQYYAVSSSNTSANTCRKMEGTPSTLRRNASASANLNDIMSSNTATNAAPLKRSSSLSFDDKLFVQTLYKVLVSVSKTSPIILYLRDVDKLLCRSQRIYALFRKMLKKLSGSVLILGSQVADPGDDYREVDERLTSVFPYNIEIKPPEDESRHLSWKSQLEEDMKMIQYQDNRNHITEVLAANDLDCDDLGSICVADTITLSNYIEEIVVSAISYHLMNTKDPDYRNGRLVISSASLSRGLNLFQEGKSATNDSLKLEAQAEVPKEEHGRDAPTVRPETKTESKVPDKKGELVEALMAAVKDSESSDPPKPEPPPDNEFEKRIRPEVIPASEIGVTFADIGAMEETKESLQELVMLPLRRPDLFKGGLLKPCRGILLFGPPGTGKTMLAKAIANEAGASFINVSMSTITSKWFGEDEKNVRALFSLAAKVSPTIIFVDEVDSMLGQRSKAGEHEAMRKIKNEFMTHWDGLLSKQGEKILVLAATNRPFDLDEAIIRRFERRIMVGLPSVENREMIMKTLLSKEKVDEAMDFKELATMTEGFSGSDLKNLCTTAAYRPVRELIRQERLKDQEKKRQMQEGQNSECTSDTQEDNAERTITIRPLNMADFREAKTQVAASFAAEGSIMSELKQWNDLYGEGGSRKKEQLSYFL